MRGRYWYECLASCWQESVRPETGTAVGRSLTNQSLETDCKHMQPGINHN